MSGSGPGPPGLTLDWVERVLGCRLDRASTRSLSQSGSGGPWRLAPRGAPPVVLKVRGDGSTDERARLATEAAALAVAGEQRLGPRVVAADPDGSEAGLPALVTSLLPGSSRIHRDPAPARLRVIGAAAARTAAIVVAPSPTLPLRQRSLTDAELGPVVGPSAALLEQAAATLAAVGVPSSEPTGLVHGDLWHGNTLWDADRYCGAIDWDFAGVGPAGVDLGSLRADAAVLFGGDAPAHVLAGWEAAAGRPADDLARWDLVAGLATPAELAGWVPNFHAQGREDLDVATTTARRDAFVAAALRALG